MQSKRNTRTLRIQTRALILLFVLIQYFQFSSTFTTISERRNVFSKPSPKYYYSGIVVVCSSEEGECEPSSSNSNVENISKEWDWEDVCRSVFAGEDQRPVILFDGVCNLCNGGVNFALDHDKVGHFRFASLQSQIGKSFLIRADKESTDLSSIVLVDKDKTYFKSEAVVRIVQKLDYPMNIVAFGARLVPNFLRNIVYEFVSNNRFRFGVLEDSCRLFDDNFESRFIPDPETKKEKI